MKILKKTNSNSIESLTLKIQKNITTFTFIIFLLIIGAYFYTILILDTSKIELSLRGLNIFLPIVTSWIGAIIAFYFSKEFSDALIQKISKYKEEKVKASKELSNIKTSFKKQQEELAEEYETTLFELLKELEKKEK